jgi:site-specific DNA-cytosine methylase
VADAVLPILGDLFAGMGMFRAAANQAEVLSCDRVFIVA